MTTFTDCEMAEMLRSFRPPDVVFLPLPQSITSMNKDGLNITVADGKYTVLETAEGLKALRYGEPWRDCVGDGLIYALACEVSRLREELKATKQITGKS